MSQKWYSNISAFNYRDELNITEQELKEKLSKKRIIPCDKSSLKTIGWDNIINGENDSITIKASDAFLFCLKTEEKLIPAAILKEQTEKEVARKEKETGSKLSKSDKEDIKENILAKMKAQAFVKSSVTLGYLDKKNNKLIVNSSSAKKVDEFTSFLRDTIGSLDIEILKPDFEMQEKLTDILINSDKYKKFTIGVDCTLKDFSDGKATISAKQEDLYSAEILDHIKNGKEVESINLLWQKRIILKINADFKISGIKSLDVVEESIKDEIGESTDAYSKIQSSMFIMIEDFNEMINDLMDLSQQE